MRKFQLVLKVKTYELYEIQKRIKNIELEISTLEKRIEIMQNKLRRINFLASKNVSEYKQKFLFANFLLEEVNNLKENVKKLSKKLEIEKEKFLKKKAELEIIEKLKEKKIKEKERYEEIQLERFLNEVYNNYNRS